MNDKIGNILLPIIIVTVLIGVGIIISALLPIVSLPVIAVLGWGGFRLIQCIQDNGH